MVRELLLVEVRFLMPPDPRDWLPEGHLAWFVLASVEQDRVDRKEDELFGDARGDELLPEFQSPGELRKRLHETKQRLDAKRAAEKKPVPRSRQSRLKECAA